YRGPCEPAQIVQAPDVRAGQARPLTTAGALCGLKHVLGHFTNSGQEPTYLTNHTWTDSFHREGSIVVWHLRHAAYGGVIVIQGDHGWPDVLKENNGGGRRGLYPNAVSGLVQDTLRDRLQEGLNLIREHRFFRRFRAPRQAAS